MGLTWENTLKKKKLIIPNHDDEKSLNLSNPSKSLHRILYFSQYVPLVNSATELRYPKEK